MNELEQQIELRDLTRTLAKRLEEIYSIEFYRIITTAINEHIEANCES